MLQSAGMSSGPRRLLPLLPLLGVALLLAQMGRFWAYVNDDAYITFRYSQALAMGRGPYFNPGEQVEGYTNASWMLLMAAIWPLVGAAALPVAAKILGALAQLGAAVLAAGLARREGLGSGEGEGPGERELRALAVLGLCAATPGLALNAVSGLETGLFSLLLTAGALAVGRESTGGGGRWGAALLGLSGLTRPEGMALAALGALVKGLALAAREGWRGAARRLAPDLALLGLLFGGAFALRAALYDGELLPNTYYAKQGGFAGIPPLPYLWAGMGGMCLGALGLGLALPGLGGALRARRALWAPVALTLFGLLSPLLTGADWMPGHRLTAPYLPLLAALLVLGWTGTLARRLPVRIAALLALGAAPASAALQQQAGVELYEEIRLRARGYATGHEALAAWLAERGDPGDTVALVDIGIVGYRNPDLSVLDLSGLTDRHVAKSPGLFLEKSYDPAYVLDRAPRFVVIILRADGRSYEEPKRGTSLHTWTTMERTLLDDPRFQAAYRREGAMEPTGSWTDGLAARYGAVRIFEHAHPGIHYLLMLFERGAPTDASPPSAPAPP